MSTPRRGVDFAGTPPAPAAILSAGFDFVGRYVGTPGNPKNMTAGEYAGYVANNIDVFSFFELTAKRALDGFSAGVADANAAISDIAVIGGPADAPVFFTVDFGPTPSEMVKVFSYLGGAKSVVGIDRMACYGDHSVMSIGFGGGTFKYGCQLGTFGGHFPSAQIQQLPNGPNISGTSTDLDITSADDFGQWNGPGGFTPTISGGAVDLIVVKQRRKVPLRELPHQLHSGMIRGPFRAL